MPAKAVSRPRPEHARGVATGRHASSITLDATAGTRPAGPLADLASPAAAGLTVGIAEVGTAVPATLLGGESSHNRRSSAVSHRD